MHQLRSILPFLLLAAASLAAYWNAWPNTLVVDDKMFAGQEHYADLSQWPQYFREAVWAPAGDENDTLYRPLLLLSFAVDSTLFPGRADIWHLVNILLHVIASLLVYVFLLRLLRVADSADDSAVLVAGLAALVFAVHPIHAEVVNSIFNRSTLFVAIGSVAGLCWLLRHLDSRPFLAWTGIWLTYWLVLFSRETGIVLPIVAVTLVWMCSVGGWRTRVRRCLPALAMLLPLLVYLAMRASAIALQAPEGGEDAIGTLGASDLFGATGRLDWHYFLRLSGVWLDALRLAVWPQPLLLYHPAPAEIWWIVGLFVHLGLITAALFLYRRGRFGMLAGLGIFYITLLPTSGLLGSEVATPYLFERSLYEPSIGLAVLLAFGLRVLQRRGDRLLAIAPVVLATFVLTPLTWARNADWSSDLALLEHEFANGGRPITMTLQAITASLVAQGSYDRVVAICREHQHSSKQSGMLSLNCGAAYMLSGDFQRAEQAFLEAAESEPIRSRAHTNLSQLYAALGRREDAIEQLEKSIEFEPNLAKRAYLSGMMLLQRYPDDRARLREAKSLFEEALRIQPDYREAGDALAQVKRALER